MLALLALLAITSTDAAVRMIRMALSATSEPEYKPVEGCRLSPVVGNYGFALLEDSYSCGTEVDGIHREQRFYATEFGIRMQYVHAWKPVYDPELRSELVRLLTRRFGPPKPATRHYMIGFGSLSEDVLRWTTERGQILLHERTVHHRDEFRSGVQLFGISHDRWQMALDDSEVTHEGAEPGAALLPKTLRVLRKAGRSAPDVRASLLVQADVLVERLVGSDANAGEVRKALAPFGIRIGDPTHYAGLEYWREPLWRAYRDHPHTEGGSSAVLRLLQLGWPEGESTGSFCSRPDTFARVIEHGEAYLAKHPDAIQAPAIRFVLAEAYETWWSAVRAQKDESLTYDQFRPVRHKYVAGSANALQKAIANYQAVVRKNGSSREAHLARRRLPRLRLGLDTGQRRFLCTMC